MSPASTPSVTPTEPSIRAVPFAPPWAGLERDLRRVTTQAALREYGAQDELLVAPDIVNGAALDALQAAADRLRPYAIRKRVPGYKKSGSVSYADVCRVAPELDALYRNPELIGALSRLAGTHLEPCPERDLHSCALYYYTEPGDHIGFHFDASHYRGARYTVLVGVVNETSQSKLVCDLYKKVPNREPTRLMVSTEPGTLVFFNGDRLWHAVSPLGEREERIVLTLEYVTDTYMSPLRRIASDFKDAVTYFGFSTRKR